MNAFDSTITDRELRELFKAKILAADGDDVVTDKFIEMEAKLAFGTEVAIFIPPLKEQELLSKLGMKSGAKLAGKIGMKWLFTGLSCATVAVATVVYKMNDKPEPPKPAAAIVQTQSTPEEQDTTTIQPIMEPAATSSTDSTVPTPARPPEALTKHMLEQLSPFLAEIIAPTNRITPPVEPITGGGMATWGFPLIIRLPEPISLIQHQSVDTTFSGVRHVVVDAHNCNVVVKNSKDQLVRVHSDLVDVGSEREKDGGFGLNFERGGPTLEIMIDQQRNCNDNAKENHNVLNIEVPLGIKLEIHNSEGNVDIAGLNEGHCEVNCDFGNVRIVNSKVNVEANSSNGQVVLMQITGAVIANADFGNVLLENINGTINANASSGSISGKTLRGNSVFHSDFGKIELNRVSGAIEVEAASGNVTIDSLTGSSCAIRADFGHVTMTNTKTTVTMEVASGNIKVNDLEGNLTAGCDFGSINITGMKGKLKLNGASGNTTIVNHEGNIDINSDYGNVTLVNTKGGAAITAHSGSVTAKEMELTDDLTLNLDYGNGHLKLKNDYNDLSFNLTTDFGKLKIGKGDDKKEASNGSIVTNNGNIHITGRAASGSITFD